MIVPVSSGVDLVKGLALKPRDVLSLLVQSGWLEPRKLLNDISVRAASHRNHNYIVESAEGPSYFVKQGITDVTLMAIRREASFYDFTTNSFSALSRHMPRFVGFIPDACMLVTELVTPGVTLNQMRVGRRAPRVYSRVGETLATLHSRADLAGINLAPQPMPFIVRIGSLSSSRLSDLSAAGVELIRTIQSFPEYEKLVTRGFETSTDRCLTHNDFKSANCILGPKAVPVLLDWEFAALGDPAWDVGCVLADVLSGWLMSMPLGGRISPDKLAEVAIRPLQTLHPALQSFWTSYRSGRNLTEDAALSFLLRATTCAGIRLGQSAYEMCQQSSTLSATELFFLQTSWNILKRPMEALVRLFGINIDDSSSIDFKLGFI
jgi:aminoglycoside phosphotransferase (APT) family kinase protein